MAPKSRAPEGLLTRTSGWLLALSLSACASHSDRLKDMRSALDANQPRAALVRLNEELDVKSEKELPKDPSSDTALLLLDRSMILQQLQSYQLSSRDLEIADKQVDLLDLSRNATHDIGKYLFSDDTGPYKAPAYEKLLVNTMNMVNYLARADLNGARIEARRLAVMQKYLSQNEEQGAVLMGPGSYLAGFTFEKSGRPDQALRYYDEALAYGAHASLSTPVSRLLESSGYRTPRLTALAAKAPPPKEGATSAENAELLVVVSYGRVPPKIARRIPIGLALTYASGALSPTDHARANQLAAQGLVSWVNFPELGRARGSYDAPAFSLDGRPVPLEATASIDLEATRAWKATQGTVVAAAITRLLTRVAAGQVTRGVSKAAGGNSGTSNIIGALLSLGVQATLTATDTPDTRSWSTLPARIAIARLEVAPGEHVVEIVARGVRKRQTLTLSPGGWAVVPHTVLF